MTQVHEELESVLLSEPYASHSVMDLQVIQDFATPGHCDWIGNYPDANDSGVGSDSGVDCGTDIVGAFVGQILDVQEVKMDTILTTCSGPTFVSSAVQNSTQNTGLLAVFTLNTNTLTRITSSQTTGWFSSFNSGSKHNFTQRFRRIERLETDSR
ncbi:unnamed protein product [Dicrocoelium dendriticum]|nr:unnamed protein product [Dicrocoelium dendriticum]